MNFIFILILLFAVMWVFVIRPQRKRQREQQQLLETVAPGAEVLTAGGLYGTIREVGEDELQVEIAPGTVVRVARRAIATVVPHEEAELAELERAQQEAEDEAVAAGDHGER